MKCFGSSTSYVSVICTYGYSFTIFLPISIACSFPVEIMQWILIGYAVFSSTSFILVNYWKELSKYMTNKRYIIMAIVITCQAGLFIMLKFYFFKKLSEHNDSDSSESAKDSNETAKNSTLLFF